MQTVGNERLTVLCRYLGKVCVALLRQALLSHDALIVLGQAGVQLLRSLCQHSTAQVA